MKIKTWVGGVVVLAVAYGGAVFGSSFYAEKRFNDQIESARLWLSINSPNLKILESSYQRGLMASTSRVVLSSDFMVTSSNRLIVDSVIKTGPWLGGASFGMAYIDSVVNLDPADTSAEFKQALNGRNFITAQTTLGFTKGFSTQVYGTPFNSDDSKTQIRYNGFLLNLKASGSQKAVNLNFKLPYLFIQSKGGNNRSVLFNNLVYEVRDGQLDNAASWASSGNQSFNFDNLNVTDSEGKSLLELGKTTYTNEPGLEKDLFSTRFSMTSSGNYQGMPISLQLAGTVKNLYYPTYLKLTQASQSGNQAQAMRLFESEGIDLLKYSPIMEIDPFVFKMGEEKTEMSMRASVGHISADEMKMPIQLLAMSKLNFRFNMYVPASWLTPAMLGEARYAEFQQFLRTGMFIRGGSNRYGIDFSMEGGRIVLNGKSIR